MKKVSLFLGMVLAASFAMAQNNDALISQIGTDHEAAINQGGNLNDAYVFQTADAGRFGSDLGEATLTQQGANNLVRLQQRAFYGDATATIIQWGNANKVHGMTESANFLQNHGLNTLDVYMKGDRNVLKSLASEAQKNINTFELDVIGSDNKIAMSQHFGLGDVDIEGDLNDVTVKQYSGQPADALDFNEADVDILGASNIVSVDQNYTNNTAVVNISGNSNEATIMQTGGVVYP